MNYKTLSIILLIVLAVLVGIYYFYLKPDTTQLTRGQEQEQAIEQAVKEIEAKDSLLELYKDSLAESKNNVKVITKTIIKEQERIIEEPLTDARVEKTKRYLRDFYDAKSREVGLDEPEIRLPEISLTNKEFKGTELLISDYRGTKQVNVELTNQNNYLEKQNTLKDEVIQGKDKIIALKDSQLGDMESTRIPVVSGRKLTTDITTHGGAVLVGFLLGIIYSNNK